MLMLPLMFMLMSSPFSVDINAVMLSLMLTLLVRTRLKGFETKSSQHSPPQPKEEWKSNDNPAVSLLSIVLHCSISVNSILQTNAGKYKQNRGSVDAILYVSDKNTNGCNRPAAAPVRVSKTNPKERHTCTYNIKQDKDRSQRVREPFQPIWTKLTTSENEQLILQFHRALIHHSIMTSSGIVRRQITLYRQL